MKKIRLNNRSSLVLLLLPFSFNTVTAQVKISNSSGAIHPEAVLHLESAANDKGFLLTRIALQATNLPRSAVFSYRRHHCF
ncbi:hypothetical protein [Chryseobacterium sp. IHB B 17019]|uniref:hypothetical protein n=1 Tax=Chryseobacterium sp. IHB B 17019 TaxID=1721091 RepID=UPI0012378164|nr:hypothetical protein [Chryseobacterium sp. IHB B 17019]